MMKAMGVLLLLAGVSAAAADQKKKLRRLPVGMRK